MTQTYADQLKDPRWQRRRLEILQRDEWRCRLCGATERTLHIDHISYRKKTPIWDYEDHWLWTLCEDCHSAVEDLRRAALRIFGQEGYIFCLKSFLGLYYQHGKMLWFALEELIEHPQLVDQLIQRFYDPHEGPCDEPQVASPAALAPTTKP